MQSQYINWINQQVLLAAADALRNQDAHLLNQLGLSNIDEATATQLKAVTADRLSCLSNFKGTLFQMRLDTNGLKLFLGFANDKVEEDDLISRAIRAGLRQPMLEELKGVTRREFSARRERMGMPDHSRGRIEVLNEEDELLVLRTWDTLKHHTDPLERFMALHEATGISLDQAYITLKQLA